MRVPLYFRPAAGQAAKGEWLGKWPEADLYFIVAGSEAAADPALEATLWQTLDRLAEIKLAVEAFAAGLLPNGRVRFRDKPEWSFSASDCGFEGGGFSYIGIEVLNPEAPTSASLVFFTGHPDGYALFEAELDGGRPVQIMAGAW